MRIRLTPLLPASLLFALLLVAAAPGTARALTYSIVGEGGVTGGATFGLGAQLFDTLTFASPSFSAVSGGGSAASASATITITLSADPGETLGKFVLEEAIRFDLIPGSGSAEALVSGFFSLVPAGSLTPVTDSVLLSLSGPASGSTTLMGMVDLTAFGVTEATLQMNNIVSVTTTGDGFADVSKTGITITQLPEPGPLALAWVTLLGAFVRFAPRPSGQRLRARPRERSQGMRIRRRG